MTMLDGQAQMQREANLVLSSLLNEMSRAPTWATVLKVHEAILRVRVLLAGVEKEAAHLSGRLTQAHSRREVSP